MCSAYFHVMFIYTITIKEDGEEWDSIQYPGNCFECNKNKKNQTISINKVLQGKSEEDFDATKMNKAN